MKEHTKQLGLFILIGTIFTAGFNYTNNVPGFIGNVITTVAFTCLIDKILKAIRENV